MNSGDEVNDRRVCRVARRWSLSALCAVVGAFAAIAVWAGPASAYNWYFHETATNDVDFSGSGCGSVSFKSAYLPRRAQSIVPQSPKVGDALQDGLFGEGVVAHISSVQVLRNADGSLKVQWTAVGSDAACDPTTLSSRGWDTDTETLMVSYDRFVGSRVYWRSIRNRPEDAIRPRWHSVLADVRFERMRWQTWGGPVAKGRGYVGHDDFIPNGHGGYRLIDQRARATFRLSRVVYCNDHRLIYTRLLVHTLQRSGGLKTWTRLSYDCGGGKGVG